MTIPIVTPKSGSEHQEARLNKQTRLPSASRRRFYRYAVSADPGRVPANTIEIPNRNLVPD